MSEEREMLTVKEVASRMRVDVRTVQRWLAAHLIVAHQVHPGGAWRIEWPLRSPDMS